MHEGESAIGVDEGGGAIGIGARGKERHWYRCMREYAPLAQWQVPAFTFLEWIQLNILRNDNADIVVNSSRFKALLTSQHMPVHIVQHHKPRQNFHRIYSRLLLIHAETLRCLTLFTG